MYLAEDSTTGVHSASTSEGNLSVTANSCCFRFWKTMHLPCRHILATRSKTQLPLYSPNPVSEKCRTNCNRFTEEKNKPLSFIKKSPSDKEKGINLSVYTIVINSVHMYVVILMWFLSPEIANAAISGKRVQKEKSTSLSFLHESNAPSDEMANHLPSVAVSPHKDNTIFWFHDESTFNANEDESVMWKDETMQVIKPKGRGAGIMVSDFIEEKDGYLALPHSTHQTLSALDPTVPQ